jgi:hypothetical protein
VAFEITPTPYALPVHLVLNTVLCVRTWLLLHAQGDYSNCRPLHTLHNALLAAAAATEDAEAPGKNWEKQHILYGNDNHYMFFRCVEKYE